MKSFCKILIFALAAFAPAQVFACAACGSANPNTEHSSLADGMNLAILTLGAIMLPVLGGFLAFLIHTIRKSEALTAAAEQKHSPEAVKA